VRRRVVSWPVLVCHSTCRESANLKRLISAYAANLSPTLGRAAGLPIGDVANRFAIVAYEIQFGERVT
jgi:hypothetical protein